MLCPRCHKALMVLGKIKLFSWSRVLIYECPNCGYRLTIEDNRGVSLSRFNKLRKPIFTGKEILEEIKKYRRGRRNE